MFFSEGCRSFGIQCDIEAEDTPPLLDQQEQPKQEKRKGAREIRRPVSKFVPSDDLYVPYQTTDFPSCERVTHVIKRSENIR